LKPPGTVVQITTTRRSCCCFFNNLHIATIADIEEQLASYSLFFSSSSYIDAYILAWIDR
jgi:hypothetical protein